MTAFSSAVFAIVASFTLASFASAEDTAPAPSAGKKVSVKIVQPKNGATVAPKFKVKMTVQGMKVAPLGQMKKGTGHHHLIIDGPAIPGGQVVPADPTHIHFGKGQTETELELAPGKHTLTLQFADGAHISYGPVMSETIEVNVAVPEPKKKK